MNIYTIRIESKDNKINTHYYNEKIPNDEDNILYTKQN